MPKNNSGKIFWKKFCKQILEKNLNKNLNKILGDFLEPQVEAQHCLELPYWHQLILSWYLQQPESHQLSLNKVAYSLTQ